MLGVSRPIYVNVDSPNLDFPYFNFLGGYQWKKSPVYVFGFNLQLREQHIQKLKYFVAADLYRPFAEPESWPHSLHWSWHEPSSAHCNALEPFWSFTPATGGIGGISATGAIGAIGATGGTGGLPLLAQHNELISSTAWFSTCSKICIIRIWVGNCLWHLETNVCPTSFPTGTFHRFAKDYSNFSTVAVQCPTHFFSTKFFNWLWRNVFEFASVGRRHANVCSTRFFNFSKCELSKTNLIRGISNLWVDGTHAAGNVYPTKIFNFPKCELICSSLSYSKLWVALDRWHARLWQSLSSPFFSWDMKWPPAKPLSYKPNLLP